MSLLAVGLSHSTAPVELLERVAPGREGVDKLLDDLATGEHVSEAVVIATCNRLEIYADVATFHGGFEEISALIEQHTWTARDTLTPHLYVHYEDRAVTHLFRVASGLDSMVVGESQILGQVREAFRRAADSGSSARTLSELFQSALRVGKRAHAETGIDDAGRSMVTVGLDAIAPEGVRNQQVLVIGAGSMAGLAVSTLAAGGAEVVVASRTPERAERLAASVAGSSVPVNGLAAALTTADLVVTCTGSLGPVLTMDDIAPALHARNGRQLRILDLALPRDVDPAVAEVDDVSIVDLTELAERAKLDVDGPIATALTAVQQVVSDEAHAYSVERRQARVAPTVVALRSMAAEVVDAELDRLGGRLPDMDDRSRAEVESTVRRVVDKLLHSPTVRVKELAVGPDGRTYENALRQLFALDPRAVNSVSCPTHEAMIAAMQPEDGDST
ncbi:MAG TPA: glutamyl-tRNA reductase [Jiangellaceae bacterium]|nr:glutamyl-tRNA reductase [Jiangellaceae bacterium]